MIVATNRVKERMREGEKMVSSALAKKVTEATEGEICSAAKKPKLKVIRATSKKGKSARIKKEEEKGVLAASSNGPKNRGRKKQENK